MAPEADPASSRSLEAVRRREGGGGGRNSRNNTFTRQSTSSTSPHDVQTGQTAPTALDTRMASLHSSNTLRKTLFGVGLTAAVAFILAAVSLANKDQDPPNRPQLQFSRPAQFSLPAMPSAVHHANHTQQARYGQPQPQQAAAHAANITVETADDVLTAMNMLAARVDVLQRHFDSAAVTTTRTTTTRSTTTRTTTTRTTTTDQTSCRTATSTGVFHSRLPGARHSFCYVFDDAEGDGGGGWELAFNLATSHPPAMHYHHDFWKGRLGHGNVDDALTTDFTGSTFYQRDRFQEVLVLAHNGRTGAVHGWGTYDVVFSAQGRTFSDLFSDEDSANFVLTRPVERGKPSYRDSARGH